MERLAREKVYIFIKSMRDDEEYGFLFDTAGVAFGCCDCRDVDTFDNQDVSGIEKAAKGHGSLYMLANDVSCCKVDLQRHTRPTRVVQHSVERQPAAPFPVLSCHLKTTVL